MNNSLHDGTQRVTKTPRPSNFTTTSSPSAAATSAPSSARLTEEQAAVVSLASHVVERCKEHLKSPLLMASLTMVQQLMESLSQQVPCVHEKELLKPAFKATKKIASLVKRLCKMHTAVLFMERPPLLYDLAQATDDLYKALLRIPQLVSPILIKWWQHHKARMQHLVEEARFQKAFMLSPANPSDVLPAPLEACLVTDKARKELVRALQRHKHKLFKITSDEAEAPQARASAQESLEYMGKFLDKLADAELPSDTDVLPMDKDVSCRIDQQTDGGSNHSLGSSSRHSSLSSSKHSQFSSVGTKTMPLWAICPISNRVMMDPVMVPADCSHKLSLVVLTEWLKLGNKTCPVCGSRLHATNRPPEIDRELQWQIVEKGRELEKANANQNMAIPSNAATSSTTRGAAAAARPRESAAKVPRFVDEQHDELSSTSFHDDANDDDDHHHHNNHGSMVDVSDGSRRTKSILHDPQATNATTATSSSNVRFSNAIEYHNSPKGQSKEKVNNNSDKSNGIKQQNPGAEDLEAGMHRVEREKRDRELKKQQENPLMNVFSNVINAGKKICGWPATKQEQASNTKTSQRRPTRTSSVPASVSRKSFLANESNFGRRAPENISAPFIVTSRRQSFLQAHVPIKEPPVVDIARGRSTVARRQSCFQTHIPPRESTVLDNTGGQQPIVAVRRQSCFQAHTATSTRRDSVALDSSSSHSIIIAPVRRQSFFQAHTQSSTRDLSSPMDNSSSNSVIIVPATRRPSSFLQAHVPVTRQSFLQAHAQSSTRDLSALDRASSHSIVIVQARRPSSFLQAHKQSSARDLMDSSSSGSFALDMSSSHSILSPVRRQTFLQPHSRRDLSALDRGSSHSINNHATTVSYLRAAS
jgi:hypothetical protein